MNFTQSAVQVGQVNRQLDVPLAVISRGSHPWEDTPYGEQQEQIWQDLQQDLLSLSTLSWQIIAAESGHLVHLQQPKLVVDTILSVLYRHCHSTPEATEQPKSFCQTN